MEGGGAFSVIFLMSLLNMSGGFVLLSRGWGSSCGLTVFWPFSVTDASCKVISLRHAVRIERCV